MGNPDAVFRVEEEAGTFVVSQTVFCRKIQEAFTIVAAQATIRSNPNIAFAVLEEVVYLNLNQALIGRNCFKIIQLGE